MTQEQQAKASIDMTSAFIANYYQDWRLAKVLALRKIINERYNFFKDIAFEIKHPNDPDGEATIAQEIKNGLHFDAISQCVQYVEDLFALIYASEKPNYFIKNVITYSAGRVTNLIRAFSTKSELSKVKSVFFIPTEIDLSEADKKVYDDQLNYLSELVLSIAKFYSDYEFFHNQYKHGLTVALRPFGNIYKSEQIEKDKAGEFPTMLKAYDNYNLTTAEKKGTFQPSQGTFILGFTENVRPFITSLSKEDNLLRLVHPPDLDLDIEMLTDFAYKIRSCLGVFLHNYYHKINSKEGEVRFQLPFNYKSNKVVQFSM